MNATYITRRTSLQIKALSGIATSGSLRSIAGTSVRMDPRMSAALATPRYLPKRSHDARNTSVAGRAGWYVDGIRPDGPHGDSDPAHRHAFRRTGRASKLESNRRFALQRARILGQWAVRVAAV